MSSPKRSVVVKLILNTLSAFAGGVLDSLLVFGVVFLLLDALVPSQDLPWTPLRLTDPIGVASRAKIDDAAKSSRACIQALTTNGVRFSAAISPALTGPCVIPTPVELDEDLYPRGPVVDCPLAAAFALWSRQGVQEAAMRLLGQRVVAFDQAGAYECRGVRADSGTATLASQPSAHARGDAIDIAGFKLEDGSTVTVAKDWADPGPRGQFLHAVRQSACAVFHVTLSPDYNQSHKDHLHLDMGRSRLCS